MSTGTVKFFSDEKGYGFIAPDEGEADVFVHKTALQESGMQSLDKDATVEYELVTDRKNGKLKAENIEVLS